MKSLNYIIDNDQPIGGLSFWDYCWREPQPHVQIHKTGTKYWKLAFDMLPVIKFSRFTKLSYGAYFIPLYKTYSESVNLLKDKHNLIAGGLNAIMTVRKEDAEKLADQMFHLLVQLNKHEKGLFDEAPVYLNEDGVTPEGFHEESYKQGLKKQSPEELYELFKLLKKGNKHKTLVLSWIRDEIELKMGKSFPNKDK